MPRKYVKRTRRLTVAEKTAFKTVRHILRSGVDVRISFVVKGWPNALPVAEPEPAPEPQTLEDRLKTMTPEQIKEWAKQRGLEGRPLAGE